MTKKNPEIISDAVTSTPKSNTSLSHRAPKTNKTSNIAERLHKIVWIYAVYGVLDGISLSYSIVKYIFDIVFFRTNSADKEMQNWLKTTLGFFSVSIGSLLFILFSTLGNYFSEAENNQSKFRQHIGFFWPYFRDVIKGFRNVFKGIRSLIDILGTLTLKDLRYLVVPLGLLLGLSLGLNRVWQRYIKFSRKEMMKINNKEAQKIKANEFSFDQMKQMLEELKAGISNNIKSQTPLERYFGIISAAYSGLLDGFYLYLGVLTLCPLAPNILPIMVIFSSAYLLASIATRAYEEYEHQQKLFVQKSYIELMLVGKMLESALSTEKDINSIKNLLNDFTKKREQYYSTTTLSFSGAFLSGMRNGLAAYGALTSGLFAVVTFLVLSANAFPPTLLITAVYFGLASLIGFTSYALIRVRAHQKYHEVKSAQFNGLWLEAKKTQDIAKIKELVIEGVNISPSPSFTFVEWFEIVRSFFSGLGKGSKALDYTGQVYGIRIVRIVMVIGAGIDSIVLSIRAFARGFGRKAPEIISLDAAFSVSNRSPSSLSPFPPSPDDMTGNEVFDKKYQENVQITDNSIGEKGHLSDASNNVSFLKSNHSFFSSDGNKEKLNVESHSDILLTSGIPVYSG